MFKGDAFNDATRARGRWSTAVAARSDSNAREINEGPKFRPFYKRSRRRGFVLELKGTRRVILAMSCLGLYFDFGGYLVAVFVPGVIITLFALYVYFRDKSKRL